MVKFSEEQIIDHLFHQYQNKSITVLAPLIRGRKGHYRELFQDLTKKGYSKSKSRWRSFRNHTKTSTR
jgi:excinuclease ABC subunit A